MAQPIVFVDIETTGLNQYDHGMVSLGAVTEDGATFEQECQLREGKTCSPIALEINGYTEEELRDPTKPSDVEIYNNFVEWCEGYYPDGYILCGKNLASFDVRFLKEISQQYGAKKWPFGHSFLDLNTLCYLIMGQVMKQDEIREKLGLEPEPKPHTSLTGAITSKTTWDALLKSADPCTFS